MLHIAGQARGQTLMHNHNVQYCVIRLFYMASSSPQTQRKILLLVTTFSLVLFKTETTRLNQITNLNHLHMQPWLITHSFRIKETTGRVIFHLIRPVFSDARAPPPPTTPRLTAETPCGRPEILQITSEHWSASEWIFLQVISCKYRSKAESGILQIWEVTLPQTMRCVQTGRLALPTSI